MANQYKHIYQSERDERAPDIAFETERANPAGGFADEAAPNDAPLLPAELPVMINSPRCLVFSRYLAMKATCCWLEPGFEVIA
jgi:hypothetical protein